MADIFVIGELVKYIPLENNMLVYHTPFTYQVKMTTALDFDETSYFFTVFTAVDETNKARLNIKGVIVGYGSFYPMQSSLANCESNEKTCYFDFDDQTLYIHFNHLVNPFSSFIEYGRVYGFTNDEVRDFNGIDYLPEILSIPNMQDKVDPLQYTRQAFYGGNILHNNTSLSQDAPGLFETLTKLYGNDYNILIGEDGDGYDDLTEYASFYIDNLVISLLDANFNLIDKRKQESKKIPTEVFTVAEFHDIDTDLVDTIMPDAYGKLYYVPGICVNSTVSTDKLFFFAREIQSSPAPVIEAEIDGVWTVITPDETFYDQGMLLIDVSDAHIDGDNTKGLNKIRLTAKFRDYSNPGNIIKDINLRYLGIEYNISNYNTTEFADEQQYLEDIGLYMDTQKDIYEWFEMIQNGSTVGFQYMIEYGKRTMRLDNPNRTPVMTIESVLIKNNDSLKYDENGELYATSALIKYRENHTDNTFLETENFNYYNIAYPEHRKDEQYNTESLLQNESAANDKSIIIMEDLQKTRFIIDVELHGREFFELRIFDIIYIELSYPGEYDHTEYVDEFVFTDDDADPVHDITDMDIETEDLYSFVDWSQKEIRINAREFLGWNRCQIIGKQPDFVNGDVILTLRQRDYSNEFDSITGYSP